MNKLNGVLPPMITPFKENGDADYDAFVSNLLKWNNDKLCGYLVLGSNSETAFLNEEEKTEFVKLTVENAAPGRIVIAGTGLESPRETIRFTNKCAELGVGAALVLTPSYYAGSMNSKALIKFFTEVADNSDIPVMIYNVSKFTHVNIQMDAVAELSKHPNIVGMKDSNGDVTQLANFVRVADPSFQVLTGTFAAWYPALSLGVTAIISAMANCSPNEIAEVQELFDAGDWQGARDIYQRMLPLNAAVTGTYGIAGLKYASDYVGYSGGHVRSPLSDSSDSDKAALGAIFKNTGVRKITA